MMDDAQNVATTEGNHVPMEDQTMEAIVGDRYRILDRRPPGAR